MIATTLHGLIIDIDRKRSDVSRYNELRLGIVESIRLPKSSWETVSIDVSYVHFTDIKSHIGAINSYDFFILSPQGSPWSSYTGEEVESLNFLAHLARELIVCKRAAFLGICGGHQFLGMAFGGEVGFIDNNFRGFRAEKYPSDCLAERDSVHITTIRNDPIFDGLPPHPTELSVMENHVEEIKTVPPGFVNLASSRLSKIQIMRFPGRIVYGMAFHPERGWDLVDQDGENSASHGRIMLANFLKMVCRAKGAL